MEAIKGIVARSDYQANQVEVRKAIRSRYTVHTSKGEASVGPEVFLARRRPAVARVLRDTTMPIMVRLVLKCVFSKTVLAEARVEGWKAFHISLREFWRWTRPPILVSF